jgi:hypothetical protein
MGYGEKIVSADSFRSGGVEVLFYFLCPGHSHMKLSLLAAISSLVQLQEGGFGGFYGSFRSLKLFF